jgi:hypothetical protein
MTTVNTGKTLFVVRHAALRTRNFHFLSMLFVFCLAPAPWALAQPVAKALFNISSPSGSPFPSNLFTVPDAAQNTGRRVNLPLPDCTPRPSDCADLAIINTLDGFNLQPRLAIPFDRPIDLESLIGRSIFLVSLGSTLPGTSTRGKIIALNQFVWEPTTNTLYAESDELLDQHTRYGLIVTRAVRDRLFRSVKPSREFKRFLKGTHPALQGNPALVDYRNQIFDAIAATPFESRFIVAASVFTTQSATSDLEKIRNQLKAKSPDPATFLLGPNGERTVFPLHTVTSFIWTRHIGQAGSTPTFDMPPTFLAALQLVPGAIGTIAFGKYRSPDYETAERVIPAVGTLTGEPKVQGENDIYFNLFLPAGIKPANGWPVAIFGHGFTDSKQGAPFAVAAVLAQSGIATIAINVVGHGGGPLSTLTVTQLNGSSTTFPEGGRGIDQNGDGTIDATEGVDAAPTKGIISNRDGLRQTTIDLMQLVREIQVGVDADGDSVADLDDSRIYYAGQSFGGIYGAIFLGVEPDVRVGVLNVPGGSIPEVARLGSFRPLVGLALHFRSPSLDNLPPTATPNFTIYNFNENIPLRNQPPIVNAVPGAIAIQQVLENAEWVSQSGNPVAYAPHLRKDPLPGVPAKTVIIQFARGDQTVPNPTTTAILRAGNLADRATFFRNDLAYKADQSFPKNPHAFLTNLDPSKPAVTAVALATQTQIATFLASDGAIVIDPDGPLPLFETPIISPLPEDLGFIP